MRGLALVTAAALVIGGAWVWRVSEEGPQTSAAAVAASHAAPKTAARPVEAPAIAETPEEHSVPLTTCAHQHVDITRQGVLERACVATTRTTQNGSVRGYLLDAEGLSGWRLAVDTAGGRVISARLSRGAADARTATTFVCDNDECAAIRMGKPDSHGERTMRLDGVLLRALPPGVAWRRKLPGAGAAGPADRATATSTLPEALHLTAALLIPPDSQQPRLACTVPAIGVLESDGAFTDFCPTAGAGFEFTDSGRPSFRFRNLDGLALVVTLADDGSVEKVEMGPWSCEAPQCGGLGMRAVGDPADPSVERHFSFSGTTLRNPSSHRLAATLNGRIVMPAQ